MSGPFIFIATNKLKEGKLEDEKRRVPELFMEVVRERAARAYAETLEATTGIQVFGPPRRIHEGHDVVTIPMTG